MLIIGNNERSIFYIIEYTVKFYVVSVFKWGIRDLLLVLVEESHKRNSVCCLLGHEMFSFIHDLLHRVHFSVYIECGLTHLISFVLLVATMILHMHVVAK